jgi:phage/plasmid-associated DNA primase
MLYPRLTLCFSAREQDCGLKGLFRKSASKSAILNWLIDGCRLMLDAGMDVTERMQAALDEYRAECDSIGNFFAERISPADGKKLQTSALYAAYTAQAKLSGNRPMSVQSFVGEVKKRYNAGATGRSAPSFTTPPPRNIHAALANL